MRKEHNYHIMHLIYPVEELDIVSENIDAKEGDIILLERLGDAISQNILSEDELAELLFYSVMTNDPEDPKYILEHPELCERCGWCCSCIGKIELLETDIERLGTLENVSIRRENGKEVFNLDTPCPHLLTDKRCGVYQKRPASCRNFPLGLKNNKVIVQRNLECGFIYNFLFGKVMRMIDKVIK